MIVSLAPVLAALLPMCPLPGDPPPAAAGPAAFFPAHTLAYLELRPQSCVEGVKGLNLLRLLEDRVLGQLARQAMASIPPDADPRAMLARYPFDRAIGDRVALGLVGVRVATRAQGDTPRQVHLLPESGQLTRGMLRGNVQGRPLIVVELRDAALFEKTVAQLLADLAGGEAQAPVAEEVDGVAVQVWRIPGLGRLCTRVEDGHLLVAQFPADLVAAVRRQQERAVSLATRADFGRFAALRGERRTAGFLHLSLDSMVELASPLIPRRDREEIAKWGGFDCAGLQLGMGFHDGGICEWMHLAFADNPRGILLNLARLWPSAGYVVRDTPRGQVYAASATLDLAALVRATRFVLDLFDVDTKSMLADANACLGGLDLEEDVLGALGDTVGAVGIIPRVGLIPELSLVFKVRDRARMWKVLQHVKAMCAHGGLETRDFTVSGDGPKATFIELGKDLPIKPAFALTGDKLVVSVMPLTLKYAIRKSRHDGEAIIDCVPDPSAAGAPAVSWFYDPAQLTENLYADVLKLLDAQGGRLPFEVTDLPSPDFVARCTSKVGIELAADAYGISACLHSPTSFSIPLVLGAAAAAHFEEQQRRQRVGTTH